jgi:hypothetical protein
MRIAFGLFLAVASRAEVTGIVANGTTSRPQAGATVTLYKLGESGMDAMTSVKSGTDGSFMIPDKLMPGPHLIQTAFDGVTYNHMLPPGRPTTDLSLTVYNSSKSPGEAAVQMHMILFEANGMELNVSESVIYRNPGKTSFNDPDGGTLQFYLPPGAGGRVKVMGTAPQGMPIERAARKTSKDGVYSVDFPVKPGETRIDLSYAMPMTGPAEFKSRILHTGPPARLVVPSGMELTSSDTKLLGQEPATQASIYELAKNDFAVTISGTGALRGSEAQGPDEDEAAGIRQIWPRLYDRYLVVLALAAIILLSGMALLARRQPKIK